MKARSGEIMGYLAYGHPFLDGNGCTIMTAHSALAQRAGFNEDQPAAAPARAAAVRRSPCEHHHHQRRAPNAPRRASAAWLGQHHRSRARRAGSRPPQKPQDWGMSTDDRGRSVWN
jgi:fido (protein-threonine AMPylation protein)